MAAPPEQVLASASASLDRVGARVNPGAYHGTLIALCSNDCSERRARLPSASRCTISGSSMSG